MRAREDVRREQNPNHMASQEPISFHRFWSVDPKAVYNDWFAEVDKILPLAGTSKHTEL